MSALTLRRATAADARLLWEWVNDSVTRASAFQSEPITWADHQRWFAGRLQASDCEMFVAEENGVAVGQIRFDRSGGEAEVDISVAPACRQRGLGVTMLREASVQLQRRHPRVAIVARVKPENRASLRTFEQAGFVATGEETVAGHPAIRLERRERQSGSGTRLRPDVSECYLVAARGAWNREVFDRCLADRPGRWILVDNPDSLATLVRSHGPRYIFFVHWSWKVPAEIVNGFECVGFHMTDLPYGRGGSPLQNLILRGHRTTVLSAFRLSEELDAGPIYLKAPLALDGSAQDIYVRASELAARMVGRILDEQPVPEPQSGDVVEFRRRTPAESRLPDSASIDELYDFIRMLDAEGYPHAYTDIGGARCEFTGASLDGGVLRAQVRLTPAKDGSPS